MLLKTLCLRSPGTVRQSLDRALRLPKASNLRCRVNFLCPLHQQPSVAGVCCCAVFETPVGREQLLFASDLRAALHGVHVQGQPD